MALINTSNLFSFFLIALFIFQFKFHHKINVANRKKAKISLFSCPIVAIYFKKTIKQNRL